MKRILRGPIYKLYVKNLEINDTVLDIELASTTLKKDALFYINSFGKIVSLDYNTVLPQKEEAQYYIESHLPGTKKDKINPNSADCVYFEDSDLEKYQLLSQSAFKQLKKTYKKRNF